MLEMPRDLRELRTILAADWARDANQTPPQYLLLALLRIGQYLSAGRRRGPFYYLWRIADLLYVRILLGAEISPLAKIGPGFALPHVGRGVLIHPDVQIGANSMIHHRVTIGESSYRRQPRIGDDLFVGPGACILGDITIGSRVRIGPNAVVTRDLPDDAVAFGVPARAITVQPEDEPLVTLPRARGGDS